MSVAFTEESLVLVTVPKPFGGCRAGAAVAAAAKKVSGAGDPGQKLAHITLRHFLKKSRTQHATALYIAEAYLDLGDKDRAFEWLGRSYQEPSTVLYTIKVDTRLDLLALQQTEWEEQMPQKQIVIQEQ